MTGSGPKEAERLEFAGKRVWLIGENNPYGPDPRYALYPRPEESAGGRLCHRILEMSERDYLRSFERAGAEWVRRR